MSRSQSQPLTITFEVDEDGDLYLVDAVVDATGLSLSNSPDLDEQDCETPDTKDLYWFKNDFDACGFDLITLNDNDELRRSSRLVVQGHMWCAGPYSDGDYDGGFEITKVVERVPL